MPSAVRMQTRINAVISDNPNLQDNHSRVVTEFAIKNYISSLTLSDRFTDTIPASSTKVVDIVPQADAKSIKWDLVLIDAFTLENHRTQVICSHNGTTVNHNVYGEVNSGNNIGFIVDVNLNGTDVELSINNSETHDINISGIQVKIL